MVVKRIAGLVLGILVSAPAWADEVVLNNGAVFSGVVREQGGKVHVEVDFGTMTFNRSQVRSIIRSENPIREFGRRKAEASDADGCFELGLWAREKGLKTRARDMFRKAIGLNPDHERARTALGYLRFDGRWLTEDEFMVARGFIKQRGEWLKRETVERREDTAARERIEVARERTTRDLARLESELERERIELERQRIECERRRRRRWFGYSSTGFGVWPYYSYGLGLLPGPPTTSTLPPAPAWPSPITPMNLIRTNPVQNRPVPAARPPKRLPPAPPWPSPITGRRP